MSERLPPLPLYGPRRPVPLDLMAELSFVLSSISDFGDPLVQFAIWGSPNFSPLWTPRPAPFSLLLVGPPIVNPNGWQMLAVVSAGASLVP